MATDTAPDAVQQLAQLPCSPSKQVGTLPRAAAGCGLAQG
ncbi:hypothetical protein MLPF_0130 [Mycobacterium lepromatosis]|nr:hypothetical protein MLPF_0130 [Mycobacterium lepromatosis]